MPEQDQITLSNPFCVRLSDGAWEAIERIQAKLRERNVHPKSMVPSALCSVALDMLERAVDAMYKVE